MTADRARTITAAAWAPSRPGVADGQQGYPMRDGALRRATCMTNDDHGRPALALRHHGEG